MSSVSEQLLDALAAAGVRHLFGIVGDAINPLVDAVRRDDRIEWVHVRHEETGAFAASAQAKLTGSLAACAGTVGPGAIHLLNGLYDAKKDHAPVLAITGQVPREDIGTDFHQEVDLPALFSDVAVFSAAINVPEQAGQLAAEAIAAALAHRGVAHLVLPSDLGAADAPARNFPPAAEASVTQPDADALARAARAIDDGQHITILAGTGCRDAVDELLDIAARLQAPIVHTLRAKDLVDHDHPL